MMDNKLFLGYDYDSWLGYSNKESILIDISAKSNSHILLSGISGSGKSFALNLMFANLISISNEKDVFYFADFKGDDSFAHLRDCKRYFFYKDTTKALNEVYEILQARQSGEDKSRNQITLFWDEYVADLLSLISENKKNADEKMRKVSEILMLGRSLRIRLILACQRPDAVVFPVGSRLNFGIVIILGTSKSTYEMLLQKEFIEQVGSRVFEVGEGIALFQSSIMRFIKIPLVRDEERLKKICMEALSR